MYIESMTLPTSTNIPQLREIRIKATSWAPPPKVPKKSKSSTPSSSENSGDPGGIARKGLGETGAEQEADYDTIKENSQDIMDAAVIDKEYNEWITEQQDHYGPNWEPGDDP